MSKSNTYHTFGFAACHQIGQKVFIVELAKNMGIVGHHYGDFFHHFAGKLPLAARAGWQSNAAPWLSSVSVVHTHPKKLTRKECHKRKYDPADQLPCGFSSHRSLLLSWEAHKKHLLTVPTPSLQKAFAEVC